VAQRRFGRTVGNKDVYLFVPERCSRSGVFLGRKRAEEVARRFVTFGRAGVADCFAMIDCVQ
jgi:hypothetical protein